MGNYLDYNSQFRKEMVVVRHGQYIYTAESRRVCQDLQLATIGNFRAGRPAPVTPPDVRAEPFVLVQMRATLSFFQPLTRQSCHGCFIDKGLH